MDVAEKERKRKLRVMIHQAGIKHGFQYQFNEVS